MLALAVYRLKSRLKFGEICSKNKGYPLLKILLSFCLHKINIFYTPY